MPIKLGKSHTTIDRATKKATTVHPYIKGFSKTDLIEKYNKFNMFHQLQIIKETLDIITGKKIVNEQDITESQIDTALNWCKKYNIDINFGSSYLQNVEKYKSYFDLIKYEKWKQNKYFYS